MNARACIGLLLLVLGAGAAGSLYFRGTGRHAVGSASSAPTANSAPAPTALAQILPVGATNQLGATPPVRAASAIPFASFRHHPLAITRESSDYQWTAEDGRETNIIRQLAHNNLEYERMVEENGRIYRRQLVYHKETADLQVQRARLLGESIRQMTLPALDGLEVQFEISKSDLNASGQQGSFSGHLAGRPDSMVTFAFKGGREAFTVVSPSDGLYLQGDPREPGELIVKLIDPRTYVVGVCGNP